MLASKRPLPSAHCSRPQAPLERREDLRQLILRAAPVITRTMPRAVHFAAAPHFKARAEMSSALPYGRPF